MFRIVNQILNLSATKKWYILFCISLLVSSCSKDSFLNKIKVTGLIDPDKTPPIIEFQTTPGVMQGDRDFTVNFKAVDNVGGGGIKTLDIYYSPDLDSDNFKKITSKNPGDNISLKFCVPNKNHPKPGFKIIAKDKSGNTTETILGDDTTQPFSINLTNPNPSNLSVQNNLSVTNQNPIDLLINACKKTECSNDAIYYEEPDNSLFVLINSTTQPTAGDPAWVSCQDVLSNGFSPSNFTINGNYTYKAWTKSVAKDFDQSTNLELVSNSSSDVSIEYDTSEPVLTTELVEGTNLTGQSKGVYRLTNCNDFAKVKITKGLGAPPSASDNGWQDCSSSLYSLYTRDFVSGDNNLQFWVKDDAENVATSFLSYTTKYVPPTITVVGGPTIATPVASMTIQFCNEASIAKVLFNETGITPTTPTDSSWQNCSTAIGALKSASLSPGSHTLKAFFLYSDNGISPNPVDVAVNYSPTLSWYDTPVINRPQSRFTVASCAGISHVLLNKSTAPLATDPGWVPCSTSPGAITFSNLSIGTQTINAWFKNAANTVFSEFASTSATYTPPQANLNNGTTITATTAKLTITDCNNVSKVLVKVDDSAIPTVADASWVNCSTANNAINSPTLSGVGNHTLYTWFKFTDNYIIPDPDIDNIVYDPLDGTPPTITAVNLTLNNGFTGGAWTNLLVKNTGTYVDTTQADHVSRARFTINTCTPTGSSDPKEDISHVLITSNSNIGTISANDPYWQTCSTTAEAIQGQTLAHGTHNLYFYFKDQAGNISGYSGSNPTKTAQVTVDILGDVTPPPRPYVEIINPPTLTSSPAQMWVNDANNCSDIDQVYINIYSRQYDGLSQEILDESIPSSGAAGWQNCKVKPGSYTMPVDLADTFEYPLILSGSYTLNVWFKDAVGNINTNPRRVSFIFNPIASTLPNPIAYWSFDKNHFEQSRIIDVAGTSHGVVWKHSLAKATLANGKIKEGYDLAGNTFAVMKNTSALKPTVSVAVSAWVHLIQNDNTDRFIAGNLHNTSGYGLTINSSKLKFTVNGRSAEIATSTYTTGLHLVVGSADGQMTELYIDGELVASDDAGVPQNISQGSSSIFTIGAKPGTGPYIDTTSPQYFNNKIDEVVVWGSYLNATQIFRHYVDGMNLLKVNQHNSPSPTLAGAGFYGEFMQNALLTMNSCNNIKWVYVNETTHPPTKETNEWQPCNTLVGGIVHPNLSQGYHELKVWTKDAYDNLSSTYIKVDTTITGLVYHAPPTIYFTLDNNHLLAGVNTIINDIFNGLVGDVVGPDNNQTGVGYTNEGFYFQRAQNDYVEALYAANSQIEDNLTLSLWARLTKNDNRPQVIAGNRAGAQGYSIEIESATNNLSFIVETLSGTRKASVSTASFESGFRNIVGTYDGTTVKLYLDGQLVTDTNYGSSSNVQYTCLSSFTIGAGASCNLGPVANSFFDNSIDEILVWNAVLDQSTIEDVFNGQDTVPPLPVAVTPKNNNYTVTLPIANLKTSVCNDIASVYVALDGIKPSMDAANWQACNSTLYTIKTPLLENGSNNVRVWFKDAAGNVSDTSTNLTINFNYDFTVPNPLAYWPFDLPTITGSTALDVFGTFHAQMYNSGTTPGTSDQALIFNGTSTYLEVPHAAALNFADVVSLSTWINISAFPGTEKFIVGKYNDGGYAITLNGSSLIFKVKTDNISPLNQISTTIDAGLLNTWINIVAVYDQGVMKLFINGLEIIASTVTLPEISPGVKPKIVYTNNNSFIIGASSTTSVGANGNFFNGKIDDTALFAEPLNDTVASEIYQRGFDGNNTAYDTTPPDVPVTLNILYYNSLVSRANLTVTDCNGLEYIIVTNSTFPPSKTDEDWQSCNTLTGGLLTKQLATSDAYGKFWTKDRFGNVSKTFNYVPITTNYDKPIQRPSAHWTFDTSHFNNTSKIFLDRIGQKQAISEAVTLVTSDSSPSTCIDPDGTGPTDYGKRWCYPLNPSAAMTSVASGVLNQKISGSNNKWIRLNDTSTVNFTDKLSVAAWVYVPNNYDPNISERHVVSIWEGGKGYAIRMKDDVVNPKVEFVVKPQGQAELAPYLETKNLISGWHLILGTYSADTGKASLYVDGIFVKSFSAATPAPIDYTINTRFMIGANPNTTDLPEGYVSTCTYNSYSYSSCTAGHTSGYEYSIDEVLVWNKVVSGLEASSLYHNGADVIYPTDTTPPSLPSLTLENSRPVIHTNKAYFSVSACNDISGVLVNEGTIPDKQDDRWEICRTRLGSFGIKNLTPGGHTVTFWFKDLAGNVTPVSQDYVVDYESNLVPRANAYWPLDQKYIVSNIARDIVSLSNENDLHLTGFERTNPTGDYVNAIAGKGVNLYDSHLTKYDTLTTSNMSRLIRPVNFMTVGGWFYLTNSDGSTRTLIDNHAVNGSSIEAGYAIYMSSGQLRFRLGLDLSVSGSNAIEVTRATSSYSTGWHYVLGVWTGQEARLLIDGVQVATTGILPEENYIRYIDNASAPILTFFRIGASSNTWDIPTNYFNEKIDEVAVWGFDLNSTQATQAFNTGNAGDYLESLSNSATNVDNAFVYYHDSFGKRVRLTILDCTNTPFIYIGPYSGVAIQPTADDTNWRDCRLESGAILSDNLPHNITAPQYVHVWSKNNHGQVSTIPATLEIPVITNEDLLVLPDNYYSFNNGHIALTNAPINFFSKRNGSYSGATLTSGAHDQGLNFSSTNTFSTNRNFNLLFKRGFTVSVWANLVKTDTGNKTIFNSPDDPNDLNLSMSGGNLYFQINRNIDSGRSFSYKDDYDLTPSISVNSTFSLVFPMSQLPQSGWTMLTVSYDMQNMYLYVNGEMAASQNAPSTQWQTLINRPSNFSTTPYLSLSHSTTSFTGAMDEFMTWSYSLTNQEIARHYYRIAQSLYSNDTTPPTIAGRTISIDDSTEAGGKWPSINPNPLFTINDCSDTSGIYISINDNTIPRYDSSGWITCNQLQAGLKLPNGIVIGDNDIRIWFKDAAGNVQSVPLSTIITYTEPNHPNPVAYWSFDANTIYAKRAFEFGPNHLNTELYNIGSTVGKVGEAATFDSQRSFIKVDSHNSFKPTDQLSLSYWYNAGANSNCNDDEHLFGVGDKNLGYSVRLEGYSTTYGSCATTSFLTLDITLSGTRYHHRIPTIDIPGGWVHLIHTFDGRYIKTYLNSSLVRTDDLKSKLTIQYPTNLVPLIIGAAPNGLNAPRNLDELSNNSFDEFAIFDKSLTPYQVLEIYNKGNSGTRTFDPIRSLADNQATLDSRFSIYQKTNSRTFGNRIKTTISDCTDTDLVMVTESTTAPSANSKEWQVCNTALGGTLSAPMGLFGSDTSVTPRLWVKTFNGTVSTNYGTASNAPITIKPMLTDMSKPSAYWTFNSQAVTQHQNANTVFDFIGLSHGLKSALFAPSLGLALEGDGLSFNGIDKYLEVPVTSATNTYSDISLSLWAYLKKGENTNRTLISNANGSSGTGIKVTTAGHLEFFVWALQNDSSGSSIYDIDNIKTYYSVTVDTNLYQTGWRHITGTYNGKSLKLYLDGTLINSYNIQFYDGNEFRIFHNDVTSWMIGAQPGTTSVLAGSNTTPPQGAYYNDQIDEVSIYENELSANEIYYMYLYGAQFKSGFTDDAIAPNDPGIALEAPSSTITSPFARFTTPTCTAPNGQRINSFYIVHSSASAPTVESTGWQFCSLDSGFFRSPILERGENTIRIYVRDEDNDISTPIDFTVTYDPPEISTPLAYYSFDPADRISDDQYKDLIGDKRITAAGGTYKNYGLSSAKYMDGYYTWDNPGGGSSYQPILNTYSQVLTFDKNFSISFWVYPKSTLTNGIFINKNGEFSLSRNANDQVIFTFITKSGSFTKTTSEKLIPNAWNFVAVTRKDNQAKIFINSNIASTFTVNSANLEKSANMVKILDTEGVIDEIGLYDIALSDDEIYYNYFKGAKSTPEGLDYQRPNYAAPSFPTHYWNFDDSHLTLLPSRLLEDVMGANDLSFNEGSNPIPGPVMGNTGVNSKVGESIFIDRYETLVNNPDTDVEFAGQILETENTVGDRQFLESGSNVTLSTNFSISGWVNFTKSSFNGQNNLEFYTVLDQWGDLASDQTFSLYQHLATTRTLTFKFKTQGGTTHYLSINNPTFNSWHHLAIIRKGEIVTMYLNGEEVASLDTNDTNPLATSTLSKLRFGESNLTDNDEKRFEGYLDEWAIWTNKALSLEQVRDLYTRGNSGLPIYTAPVVILTGSGSTTNTATPGLTVNDCGPYDSILIGYDGENGGLDPLHNDPRWQTCSTIPGGVLANLLGTGINNLKIWFKTGTTVSATTTTLTVNYVITDNTAPTPPASISLVSGNPTTSAFAKFTLSSCTDAASSPAGQNFSGVFVGKTSSVPTAGQAGWKACTTSVGGHVSPPLEAGNNSISVWFKDDQGNIAKYATDFTIRYNIPNLLAPELFMPFSTGNSNTNKEFNQVSTGYIRDSVGQSVFAKILPAGLSFDFLAVAEEGAEITGSSYLESLKFVPTLASNTFSFSGWIRIPNPTIQASLINQWDGSATNNRFAVTVDSAGRLCFDYQTTTSIGSPSWTTNSYRHSCSVAKITFSEWNHVALSRSGSSVSYYINGIIAGTDTIDPAPLKTSNITTRIGAQGRGGYDFTIDGQIDEFALFDYALSQDQVESSYALGYNDRAIYNEVQPQAPDLASLYFDMDDSNYTAGTTGTLVGHGPFGAAALFNLNDLDAGSSSYTTSTTGLINQGRYFAQKNILESSIVNIGLTADFSIGTWIKPDSSFMDPSKTSIPINKWENSDTVTTTTPNTTNQIKLRLLDNFGNFTPEIYYQTTAGGNWPSIGYNKIVSDITVTNNSWNYVFIIREGGYLSIYINGKLGKMQYIGTEPLVSSTQKLTFGGTTNTYIANRSFKGSMDDIAIFDHAVTERKSYAIYQLGSRATAEPLPQSINYRPFLGSNSITTVGPETIKAKLTLSGCGPYTKVLFQHTSDPDPTNLGDIRWQNCNNAHGVLESPNLNSGNNIIETWVQDGVSISGPYDAQAINYIILIP